MNDLVIVDNALNDSMLNPKSAKERNLEDKENNREDASEYEKKNEDACENIERNGNTEMHEEANINNHVEEANKNEGISVRKSSRIQKKRMVITEDEMGDCDDKNDPDYNDRINQIRPY